MSAPEDYETCGGCGHYRMNCDCHKAKPGIFDRFLSAVATDSVNANGRAVAAFEAGLKGEARETGEDPLHRPECRGCGRRTRSLEDGYCETCNARPLAPAPADDPFAKLHYDAGDDFWRRKDE